MPHPTKKQRLEGQMTANGDFVASFDDISVDVLPNIFAFLTVEDIMRSRRINKKVTEAVRKTIVPPTNFIVNSVIKVNTMRVMTTEMPNLQQIDLHYLGKRNKWSDGEDPNGGRAAHTASRTTHDIEILSNFRKLRILEINAAELNGRYPSLFNFPLLQKLSLLNCHCLKWNLEMLGGLPLLKELECTGISDLTGNISSLRVLKDRLEKVNVHGCGNVEGNLMDLADFPHLKVLNLGKTAVTGDIRDICGNHYFSSLEELNLPSTVYGGKGCKLQLISDAPDLARAVYLLKKQRPALFKMKRWYASLSEDSLDWYGRKFFIYLVHAGCRVGYQWRADVGSFLRPFEVNWLDPEPDRESSSYTKYIEQLQNIERRVDVFKGFHQPPTQEELSRLVDEFYE